MTDTITCPACEAQNPADFKFCEHCGTELQTVAESETDGEEKFEFEEGEQAVEAEPEETTLEAHDEYVLEEISEPHDEDEMSEDDGEEQDLDEVPVEAAEEFEADADSEPVEDADLELEEVPVEAADEVFEEDAEDADLELEEVPVEAADEVFEEDAEDVEFEEAAFDDESFDDAESIEPEPEPAAPAIEAQRTTQRPTVDVEPLPVPGEYAVAPSLTIYRDQKAHQAVELVEEMTLIGTSAGNENLDLDEQSAAEEPVELDSVEPIEEDAIDEEVGDEEAGEEEFVDAQPLEAEAAEPLEMDAEAVEPVEDEEFDVEPIDDHEDFEAADSKELAAESGATAHVDLSKFVDAGLANKHVAIFKQNKNYTLYVLADEPTQLNDELLELGARRSLSDGDIVVLGEEIALRFELEAA